MLTKEEIVGNLRYALIWNDKPEKEVLEEVLKMAMKEPCDDAISRQAVEEIINDIRDCISVEGYWAILERMKKLPSVTPNPCEDSISRQAALDVIAETDITNGTEPVFTGKQVQALLQDLPSVTPIPCDDAISRRAALDAINIGNLHPGIVWALQSILADLPSVTPKQRMGHWIETAEEYYKAVNEYGGGVNEDTPYFVDDIACSVCLAKYSVIDNETERFDCCPSCGAKLVDPPAESEE